MMRAKYFRPLTEARGSGLLEEIDLKLQHYAHN